MNRCNQPKPAYRISIEEGICTVLHGERQTHALAFVNFLKTLRMTPQWASQHSWAVSYKGKRVCYIKISDQSPDGRWYIRPSVQYDDALDAFCTSEGLVDLMLQNVHHCVACGKCAPGKPAVFFGQALEHVCCAPIDFEFHNPSEAELACAEKLVLYRRKQIAGSQSVL